MSFPVEFARKPGRLPLRQDTTGILGGVMTSTSLPSRMQALHLSTFDGVQSLRRADIPVPVPGPGEVLVRVRASPVNPSDVLFCNGSYGIDRTLPAVPGFEGCGDVVAAGAGLLGKMIVGKRVACGTQAGDGLWAQYAVLPATSCLPLPAALSDEQGACALVNPVSAWALTRQITIAQPDAVIQTGAAGQLGRMMIRLLRRERIPIINVVHRGELANRLRNLGEKCVLDSSASTFDRELREAAHRLNATLAIDAVAGEMTGRLLAAMPRGTVVVYGALSGEACRIDPGEFIFHGKSVEGFWLSDWLRRENPLALLVKLQALLPQLSGNLGSEVSTRLSLADAPQQLPALLKSTSAGKILLIPGRT